MWTILIASALGVLSGVPAPLAEELPRCATTAERCVGVRLFIARDAEGEPAISPTFVATQLAEANRHFAAADVAFEVTAASYIDDDAHVATRRDRDLLGRTRWERGSVTVFMVARLDNVDADGEIRGVHWRDRANRTRRWVIVSSIAPDMVLAHELGHFFGLPHSTEAVSIMNKTPRADPPQTERTFSERELKRIRARARAFIADGTLTLRRPPEP